MERDIGRMVPVHFSGFELRGINKLALFPPFPRVVIAGLVSCDE
jgi:hypothetical protein